MQLNKMILILEILPFWRRDEGEVNNLIWVEYEG